METLEQQQQRWENLFLLQKHYQRFVDFYTDVSYELFSSPPTDMQIDIGNFMQDTPGDIMVQAQREEAKSTIAIAYSVWSLIFDPKLRVMYVSAGEDLVLMAAKLAHDMITRMDVLECLRPDKNAGDRMSTKNFDVHYTLKGMDKTPSIKILSIGGNLPGNRAGLLISDDVETLKNARTQANREVLKENIKEYSAICGAVGRTVYLGTPQSIDSIYNTLPGKGYTIRIWPGRFPTKEEESFYGNMLAPFISDKLATKEDESFYGTMIAPFISDKLATKNGDLLRKGGGPTGERGKPTDPMRLSEERLTQIEIKEGPAYFNLHYMLNTTISNQERYPLKLRNLMFMPLAPDNGPGKLSWGAYPDLRIPFRSFDQNVEIYRPAHIHNEWLDYSGRYLVIDPAGGGTVSQDETGYCVLFTIGSYFFVMDIGGFAGGYSQETYTDVGEIIKKWQVNRCIVETNYGNGAFASALRGALQEQKINVPVEDYRVSGQKEVRIINTLEPAMARHHLVINDTILTSDVASTMKYPTIKRVSYQFLWQMKQLSRDKGALLHDDRIDALAIGVAYCEQQMAINNDKLLAAKRQSEYDAFIKDPLNHNRYTSIGPGRGTGVKHSMFNRRSY